MKLRFDPDQPHQRQAIDAVLDVWRGLGRCTLAAGMDAGRELGVVANVIDLPAARLDANLHAVQRAAGLPPTTAFGDDELGSCPQLTVEMETGTGKTYAYLRTVLELAHRHGPTKFVIVVPSVAVREGVLKTLRITEEHFASLLPGVGHRFFAYEGARLGRLRSFARSASVELMVMTLDAFNKERNLLRRPHDGFGGRTPLELLQAVRPVLVLDEPQRMESPRSRAALADLHPSLVLRYSATHRTSPGLVHRLTPRRAHELGLVKRIEVAAPAAGIEDRAVRISAQLRATVELHLQRRAQLHPRGIKVLSLLFVERVDDWVAEDGLVRAQLRHWLAQLGREDPAVAAIPFERQCAAYFAERARGGTRRAVDSRSGETSADAEAYALIMRDKERLLSLDEPVSFVISHSALREGWDSPNVFQICTLAASRSTMKKRQEVGRGVRLSVDQRGERVRDPEVDVLTVIANDSYEAYVAGLQAEERDDVEEPEAAPPPRRAGSPRPPPAVAPAVEAWPWLPIDAVRLRRDAVDAVQRLDDAEATPPSAAGPSAADLDAPVDAVVSLLRQRHPPCLVSRATIEVVLAAATEGQVPTWRHAERVTAAVVAALRRQGAA